MSYEYPNQETTGFDPVVALNRYIKEKIPEAIFVGLEKLNEFMETDAKAPVFCCWLESVEKSGETNMVAWMDGKIAVHVLYPEEDIRLKVIMSLVNSLSLDGEVLMMDGSPMTIKQIQVNNKADPLKEGQLLVFGHYGLLRNKNRSQVVQKIGINLRR